MVACSTDLSLAFWQCGRYSEPQTDVPYLDLAKLSATEMSETEELIGPNFQKKKNKTKKNILRSRKVQN